MRAVMLDVPEELLEERRRLGIDRFDEVWDGVLHMVPPPSSGTSAWPTSWAQRCSPSPGAGALVAAHGVGLYRPDVERTDYRVPDLVYARPEHVSDRGVEGRAELVIEVLSPGDETYEKMPFYAEMGVRELLVVDQSTARVELFTLVDEVLRPAPAAAGGAVTAGTLGVTFTTVAGGRLRLEWTDGTAEVPGEAGD